MWNSTFTWFDIVSRKIVKFYLKLLIVAKNESGAIHIFGSFHISNSYDLSCNCVVILIIGIFDQCANVYVYLRNVFLSMLFSISLKHLKYCNDNIYLWKFIALPSRYNNDIKK